MARIKLQSPWVQYYDKISVFFEEDPDVQVLFDEDKPEIKIYVEDQAKAKALAELIPAEQKYGKVVLKVGVIPGNAESSSEGLISDAFRGNPIVESIKTISGIFTNPITYVIFQKEVVQYYNDDLGDAYGNCSTLWQEIAKSIFKEQEGVYYCTSELDPGDLKFILEQCSCDFPDDSGDE